MPELNDAMQYYLFMKWFKTNHTSLFRKYHLHIIFPAKSKKIVAALHYIDPLDKKALQAAIDEYYRKVAD